MVKELGLQWKQTRTRDTYVNYEINIRLSKIIAEKLFLTINYQKVIINYDESQLNSTCNKKFFWD